MSYRDFTLKEIKARFGLTIDQACDLFVNAPEVAPTPRLQSFLTENIPLALAMNSEKARSELLIAPVLLEVRSRLSPRVSLFSGIDFTVDQALGLNGFCDFLLARSPEQQFISAPVVAIVEAKNEDLKGGLGQCAAEMLGVRLFNEREGSPSEVVHGVVTIGTVWRFLQLRGQTLALDSREYYIEPVAKILGIFISMFTRMDDPAAIDRGPTI